MQILKEKGHSVVAVVRPKDVLEQLCINSGLEYIRMQSRSSNGSIWSLAKSLIIRDIHIYRIIVKEKPDLLIGSDGSIARAGFLRGIPSFEWSEDDARAIKLYAFSSYTFFTQIISPLVADAWLWDSKKIGYAGYQKLAYLHPRYFSPDILIKQKYIAESTYFLLRFSALNAYHDLGMKGFEDNLVHELIQLLSSFGKVYISSEKELPSELKAFELRIDPVDMHHILAFATMLIGDSQSMSVEASILGVPSVRLSSFAGKLSVLEELEHKYGLTYGFLPSDPELMFNKVRELLALHGLRSLWNEKREKMLADKIDVTAFMVWFIENYPESRSIMKKNPDYQYRFK